MGEESMISKADRLEGALSVLTDVMLEVGANIHINLIEKLRYALILDGYEVKSRIAQYYTEKENLSIKISR